MRHAPILSGLELRILGLIRESSRSGYDLRKLLGASPGAIYPAVKRLAAAGLIEGRSEGGGGRKKETFSATPAGRRALKEGLDRPTLDEMRRDPQAVAARIRFLDGAAAVEFLEEYARLSLECAAELKGDRGLAAEHDAALYAARAKWASAALRKFS
jgi:DNA-binding PadR family transcriptional regulator